MGNFMNFIITIIFITFILPNCLLSNVNDDENILTIKISKSDGSTPKCLVPAGIHNKKIEILCYDIKADDNGKYHLFEDQCSESTEVILTRCQIGYINKKSNNTLAYLNKCINGKWENENHNNDDCELICGQNLESKTEKPPTIPLLYKGDKIQSNNVPWHVGIYQNVSSNFEQICGGSIIHSNVIITAAHCFYDPSSNEFQNPSKYSVAAGKRFRDYDKVERHEQFARIKKINTFGYSAFPIQNDIAVLTLDRHLEYSPFIEPVCVNLNSNLEFPSNYKNIVGHLYGWGSTSPEERGTSELLTVKLEPITNNQCKAMINPNYHLEITDNKFCAINKENSTACAGDGGSGLVIENENDKNSITLIGIASSALNSEHYCSDGSISTFEDIRFYQHFIKSVVSKSRDSINESLINANIKYE